MVFFALSDKPTRSALEWYRKKGTAHWSGSVSASIGEDLVNAILLAPPELPELPTRPLNAKNRRLKLKKLIAHRFAGLHKFGTPDAAPEDFVFVFQNQLELFEGRNGSGKTSLLNAILWTITGEILRPQRKPEVVADFECQVNSGGGDAERTTHLISPLTPMPNIEQYRPEQPWIHADTWVELVFVDEHNIELPPIRRTLSRTSKGKLLESPPDVSVLGVDPIALRIGTIMPGLLPLIKVGSESELGLAVAQLTGLSGLVDLADHARRAKTKIEREFVKSKLVDRDRADRDYLTAKSDMEAIILDKPNLKPPVALPLPSEDKEIEAIIDFVTKHFEEMKASAFESARGILGDSFNPTNHALLVDLEKNINRAIERVSEPKSLTSAARLSALRKLTRDNLDYAESKISDILAEALLLDDLTKNPSEAARVRLYARVANWISDHPDPHRRDDVCAVCGGELENAIDPVTGRAVKSHLHDAAINAALLSQTLLRWSENVLGDLVRSLPEVLRSAISQELPAHPCNLLKDAIIGELFSFEPFRGVLAALKEYTEALFDKVVVDRSELAKPKQITLPEGLEELGKALKNLDTAIRFARWRHDNDLLIQNVATHVLGHARKQEELKDASSLTGKLLQLEQIVKAARPISDILVQCGRLKQHIQARRSAEKRLDEYATASTSLTDLVHLGRLADEQVDKLRKTLRNESATWRSRIYLGAFPDTAHELIDAGLGRKGELDLFVQAGGVAAPAQHVTNASALRASLVGFFLAFWEFVLNERGGLTTLIFDDPQELLDDENRERLSGALGLIAKNAQLIVTSHDPRFCKCTARLMVPGGVGHHEVHPATRLQPVVRTTLPIPEIQKRRTLFDADRNAEEPARQFTDGCRVFIEAKLGDLFDDPAHSAWVIANPHPTLFTFVQRLRPLLKSNPAGMFCAQAFRRFVDHPALAEGSPVTTLMNKAHHGQRDEIRAADVAHCADDLVELIELVEQMHEECYRWRRRDQSEQKIIRKSLPALEPLTCPDINIWVCPDIAAFTQYSPEGETQEIPELLDINALNSAVAYYLRRPNFGFAAPQGTIALVEAIPGSVPDRGLVIARHGNDVLARRLVRDTKVGIVGLTAEIPDPRLRSPKTVMLPETDADLHHVIGIIFDHSIIVVHGKEEGVLVDVQDVLKRIEIAYRVHGDSAVPLALEKQIVLGGNRIELSELAKRTGALVALTLDDGKSIFKRVGTKLPGGLDHLLQFESIGGLGSSQILSLRPGQNGFGTVIGARNIIGVLYRG